MVITNIDSIDGQVDDIEKVAPKKSLFEAVVKKLQMDNVCVSVYFFSLCFGLYNCTNVSIYIGAFVELNTTNGGWNSAGIWPAVELARSHINERRDVLRGVSLEVDMKDSKVSESSQSY